MDYQTEDLNNIPEVAAMWIGMASEPVTDFPVNTDVGGDFGWIDG